MISKKHKFKTSPSGQKCRLKAGKQGRYKEKAEEEEGGAKKKKYKSKRESTSER